MLRRLGQVEDCLEVDNLGENGLTGRELLREKRQVLDLLLCGKALRHGAPPWSMDVLPWYDARAVFNALFQDAHRLTTIS